MLVSIIIPNYNGQRLLKKVLGSRFWDLGDFETELIVVDNGSTDGSVEYIRDLERKRCRDIEGENTKFQNLYTTKSLKLYKSISLKVIFNDRNLGFAKAVNQALRQAQGKYVFLLNNDVVLKSDYLGKLVNFLEKNSGFWAVQGVILTEDGEKVDNAGGKILWKGKVEKITNYKFLISNFIKTNSEPLILSATATLFRKSFFEKVGFFDEDFHSYLEDVDLSLRAWKRGLKLAVIPDTFCYHLGQATSKKMGNFKERMDAKNWIFVIFKNWSKEKLIKNFPQIFIERLRNLNGLVKQTFWWQIPSAIFSVYLEVLIKLPKMIWKRWQ